MLLRRHIEGVAASVRRQHRQGEPIAIVPEAHPLLVHGGQPFRHALTDVVQIGREAVGRPVEHPARTAARQAQPLHVEVQVCNQRLLDVRVRVQPGVRADDFRHPEEMYRPLRPGQFPLVDQPKIGPPHFQNGGAARRVVVRPLLDIALVQVGRIDDRLFRRAVARYRGVDRLDFARELFRLDDGLDPDRLPPVDQVGQLTPGGGRDHPGEARLLARRRCGDAAFKNDIGVFDTQDVRADDAHSAPFEHGQPLQGRGRRRAQHDLSGDILACIVFRAGAAADIDNLSRHLAAVAVGRFPAVDVSRSISRLASAIMSPSHRALANEAQASIGAYDAARTLIEAGVYTAGADPEIDAAIRRRPALEAFLRQSETPSSPKETLAALAAALKGDGQ